MITVDDLVEHMQGLMQGAHLSGDCEEHGEQELVWLGSEAVCPECLSAYLHNTFHELNAVFHILEKAHE